MTLVFFLFPAAVGIDDCQQRQRQDREDKWIKNEGSMFKKDWQRECGSRLLRWCCKGGAATPEWFSDP